MPKATTSITDTERLELKSLPEGFVVLRRMTYGQYLTRREMAAQMAMKQTAGRQDAETVINAMNRKVTEFEFDKCIVEHNLEDDAGNLLNFRNAAVTLELLDPRIGEEISRKITEMNDFEEDLKNSESGSTQQ